MYDGIDSSMRPRKMTLAFDAAEPMSSEGINMTSTVYPDGDQQLSWLCYHPSVDLGK